MNERMFQEKTAEIVDSADARIAKIKAAFQLECLAP